MAAKIYTFKITYAGCDNKIWRTAAVSSNHTLAELGYTVIATFDTMAYHLFAMKYKNTEYFLSEDDLYDMPESEDEKYGLLGQHKIGTLGLEIGDTVEMIYDFGCDQIFVIELLEIGDMPRGHGRAYPKILDGAGYGIVDDMSASELLEAIEKTDKDGHSGIFYDSDEFSDPIEWDYRKYDINADNVLLKVRIDDIRSSFEEL